MMIIRGNKGIWPTSAEGVNNDEMSINRPLYAVNSRHGEPTMGQTLVVLVFGIVVFVTLVPLVTPATVNPLHFYSREELQGANRLRDGLGDELVEEYMTKDAWLVPWLRAQNNDMEAAVGMIRKSLEWRKLNRMNEILKEDFSRIYKIFPYWMDGYDLDGRPIVELPLGQWDMRRAILSGLRAQIARYLYQMLERGAKRIRDTARDKGMSNITQLELIMDINGYSAKSHGCLSCFPIYIDFLTNYEANYPQMARNITLINCPRISESLLQLLRSVLTPASSNALKVYGYNKGEWKDVLLHHINPQELSAEFGGLKVRQPFRLPSTTERIAAAEGRDVTPPLPIL